MPPGSNFWYHPTLTIYKASGSWQSSSSSNAATIAGLLASTDSIPDTSKQIGCDGQMARYGFMRDTLYLPSDAVWQEILNAGFTPQPIPAGRAWIAQGNWASNQAGGAHPASFWV